MELHETEERQDLRKAVAEIAKDFGHEYYLENRWPARRAPSCGRPWANRASSG